MIAMKLNEKRSAASQLRLCAMTLSGTKSRRMFRYEPKKKNLYECSHDGWPSTRRESARREKKGFGGWAPLPFSRRGVRSVTAGIGEEWQTVM